MQSWRVCIKEPFQNCEHVYPIQQSRVKELIRILGNDENVKRMLVFGSSVTDNCHIDSDVDVYVELVEDKTCSIREFVDFAYDLWTNYNVDSRLKDEILKTGVPVYERNIT